MKIEALWKALEQESQSVAREGYLLRRIYHESAVNLFVGFRRPENRRVFLLQLPRGLIPELSQFSETRGIDIHLEALASDPVGFTSLIITLKDNQFTDVFTCLVDDVSNRVAKCSNNSSACTEFLSQLLRWRKFLESSFSGLGEEAQRGLWGELYILREHILPSVGSSAVRGWTGPRRLPHDFQLPKCALEVKTSIASQPQTMRITGERQLDDSLVGTLFLCHLSLEPLEHTAETLPDLVESLRKIIQADPMALSLFEESLLEAGYIDLHAPRYGAPGYKVRGCSFFQVRDGFPRLIEHDLPIGLGDVNYGLSVAACAPFAASTSEVYQLLRAPYEEKK